MNSIDPDKAEGRAILMDFYQLKTLAPKDYQHDSVQSSFKVDLSTEDLSKIPKEVVNHLLGDNLNDFKQSDKQIRPESFKRKVSSTGKSNYSDALGFHQNILDELIDKDILDDTRDPQLNKFMVDSKLFNPKLFLSVIHGDKSLNDLIAGINNLEKDIESKKPLLQQLITNNFEKTLSSKNSLDKIYNEFSSSNLGNEIDILNNNLASSNNSANQLLNPVLLLMSKEQELTNALSFIEKNKLLLDLPKKLTNFIQEDDFDSVLKEYERGFILYQQVKKSNNKSNPLFDKIWSNVNKVIENYKKSMINELKKIRIELINSNFKLQVNSKKPNFAVLIKRIIELNTKENPIRDFIHFQYEYISEDLDKGLAKINYNRVINARNSILNAYQLDSNSTQDPDYINNKNLLTNTMERLFTLFGSSSFNDEQIDKIYEKLDSYLVIQLWSTVSNYIKDVTEEVIDKKLLRFESIIEFFLNDFDDLLSLKAKENFIPLKLDSDDLKEMKLYFTSLITKICSRLQFVFSCTTSDLTNALEIASAQGPNAILPTVGEKDFNNLETFGYIPPNSNLISTICFSAELHNMVHDKLIQLQNRNFVLNSNELNTTVGNTILSINKQIVFGCLATLNSDIKKIIYVDNMSPSDTIEGATKLVTFMENYYKVFISKLNQIYLFDNRELKGTIEQQFLISFDLLLDGMIKNVSRQCKIDPSKSDYYYLATIYNMRTLTRRIIPSILKSFDLNFQSTLFQNKRMELFKKIDSYEYALFVEYMKEPLSAIKKIVGEGISELNSTSEGILSRLASGEVIEVSSFVLKTINYINNLKSKLLNFKVRHSFILDVQSSLISQFQKKIYDNLSSDFTDDGIYQIILDINLLLVLLKKYNTNCPESNITDTSHLEKAYAKLTSGFDVSSIDKNRESNINYNYAQFVCFITC